MFAFDLTLSFNISDLTAESFFQVRPLTCPTTGNLVFHLISPTFFFSRVIIQSLKVSETVRVINKLFSSYT